MKVIQGTPIYNDKADLIRCMIHEDDTVLDVGFWGRGVNRDNSQWVHTLLKERSKEVYGFDIEFDESVYETPYYFKADAEKFSLGKKFSVIFAGDLIEHLSNPGLFLSQAQQHLTDTGRLIITTPNAFNLFNISVKITKRDPTVNKEHTCYFNEKTLRQLLSRYNLDIAEVAYIYTLHIDMKESFKKKFLNIIYRILGMFTPKYIETLVIVAKLRHE